MAEQSVELIDDFGRITRFTGVVVGISSTGDESRDGWDKPTWTELTIWRTTGGRYVVSKKTFYRYRHTDARCVRLLRDKTEAVPANVEDTFPCTGCNRKNLEGGFGQKPKFTLDVLNDPAQVVGYLANGSYYSPFARVLLASMSQNDPDIAAVWMVQTVD